MKTSLLVLLTLLQISSFAGTGENNRLKYLPGGIISRNNDTILVKIKLESISSLQNEVKFIDESGKRKTFKPDIINGFYFDTEDDKMIFESHNDIRISALPSKHGYFVNLVSGGECPLYYFVLNRMENVGIESRMVETLYYLIYKNKQWEYISSDNFEECISVFHEYDALISDIKNGKYTFNDTPQMVKRYCKFLKE